MKTDIFKQAIQNRNYLKFLYGLEQIDIEPYYIARNKYGRKIIYGRIKNTNEVRKFEYNKIANIRIVNSFRFSPIIPINTFAS